MYYQLGVISILLILSILLLVFYKKLKDNNETFFDFETKIMLDIIKNKNDLIYENNLSAAGAIEDLKSQKLLFNVNPIQIDTDINNKISDKIKFQTTDIIKKYQDNNEYSKKQIKILENNVIDLENIINNKNIQNLNNINYSRIKSLNNGMELNLFKTPDTVFIDNDSQRKINTSLVGFNNGCLSVGSNDYNVYKCDDKNPKQYFQVKHIINETDYKQNIDKAIDFDKIDKTKISYPFAMIKSTNTDNCLTNNHGNITIQPCYSFIAQRWIPL